MYRRFSFLAASLCTIGRRTAAFSAGCAVAAAVVYCDTKKPSFDVTQLRKDIVVLIQKDLSRGPLFVRLAWHEAGRWDMKSKDGAPNSAAMRFEPACKHGANAGLSAARDLLEPLHKKHPTISYADLWSLAAVVAVDEMGGPSIPWRWGRKDATDGKRVGPDDRLPDASKGRDHIRDVFGRMGFTDEEMVALIGAHTLGECHADRSGYVGPWSHDRYGFDTSFFNELLDNDWIVNKKTPHLQFYDSATKKLMMLPTDLALILDPGFRKYVERYSKDGDLFNEKFSKAFNKLIELGCQDLNSL